MRHALQSLAPTPIGETTIRPVGAATSTDIRPTTVALPSRDQIVRIAGQTRGEIRSTAMAKRLGVHARLIRRMYNRGALPGAKEHSAHILVVPMHLLRLAEVYGLRGVERMATAGLI